MNPEAIALMVHISTVIVLIPSIVIFDLIALGWAMGKPERLPRAAVAAFHYMIWIGLLLMISSGLVMFSTYREYLLTVPAFYAKMVFVGALVVNGFIIGKHHLIAAERAFASLSREERLPLFASGAVSALGWLGACICAYLLGM